MDGKSHTGKLASHGSAKIHSCLSKAYNFTISKKNPGLWWPGPISHTENKNLNHINSSSDWQELRGVFPLLMEHVVSANT